VKTEIIGRSWSSLREAQDVTRACGEDLLASKTIPKIPHSDYRVLVTAAAIQQAKLRGATAPETKDYATGKSTVDKMLVERGLGVRIPHAQPGRVTR
jgi:hypothetical protein